MRSIKTDLQPAPTRCSSAYLRDRYPDGAGRNGVRRPMDDFDAGHAARVDWRRDQVDRSCRRCPSLFDYLCERNAVLGNPMDGVKRRFRFKAEFNSWREEEIVAQLPCTCFSLARVAGPQSPSTVRLLSH
jgi:hypothetical protein